MPKNFALCYMSRNMALALSILLLFSPYQLQAEDTVLTDRNLIPVIEEIKLRQIGGDKVLIEFHGRALSPPSFVFDGESAAVFELQRTDMSKGFIKNGAKCNDGGWELRYDYPLARRINFSQNEDGGIVARITGERPLWPKNISGMNNSDSITLLLEAIPQVVRKQGNSTADATKSLLDRNERISLEMCDVSPTYAFHMLASIAGMNFVAGESIPTASLNLSFKDTPFCDVLSCLLGITGLACSVKGNTLIIGTAQVVAETAGGYETRAYRIAYGDISKAAALVNEMVAYLKKTFVDERARTLYVVGTAAQHKEITALLSLLDHPGRQVMLEARLIEVNKSAKQEIEAMLTAVYDEWIISYGGDGGVLKYGDGGKETKAWIDAGIISGALNNTIKLLDAGLKAMESEHKGKVLASPSIVALDGHKAVIKLTRNYLYQSSVDDKGNTKFTEQETGPSLEITPTIGRDGFLTLNLRISSGEIIAFRKSGGSETPETSKREIDTCVRVRDGELFVIGGLYAESENKSIIRTPFLGYIPLIGELFTTRVGIRVSSELAFIIVPYILDIPSPEILPEQTRLNYSLSYWGAQ